MAHPTVQIGSESPYISASAPPSLLFRFAPTLSLYSLLPPHFCFPVVSLPTSDRSPRRRRRSRGRAGAVGVRVSVGGGGGGARDPSMAWPTGCLGFEAAAAVCPAAFQAYQKYYGELSAPSPRRIRLFRWGW